MKNIVFILLLLIGSNQLLSAHNYILFEKANKKKQFKLYEGKFMKCKTIDNETYQGEIVEITDSSITLSNHVVLYPGDIQSVMYPRRFFVFFSKLGLYVGGGYAAINTINHAINRENILDKSTAKIGGIGLGIAGLSYLASLRRLDIADGKWDIKLITYNEDLED